MANQVARKGKIHDKVSKKDQEDIELSHSPDLFNEDDFDPFAVEEVEE